MISAPIVLSELFSHISRSIIVNISGESGTGKTTLALYLIGNFLTLQKPYEHSCIWVQASELFPKKRLHSLFNARNEKLEYLESNIYVIPKGKCFNSYRDQAQVLRHFIDVESELPPDVKFIVIDNISHHLRLELSTHSEIRDSTNIIDLFYDEVLSPLLLYCIRKKIHLILLHEVSFDMKAEQQRPFLHKLYSRLDVLHIHLLKLFNSHKKKMKISCGDAQWELCYKIENTGFVWL